MNKLLYFVAAMGLSVAILEDEKDISSEEVLEYRYSDQSCNQKTFFSYARSSSDQVYFPVLKSVIHHTYN